MRQLPQPLPPPVRPIDEVRLRTANMCDGCDGDDGDDVVVVAVVADGKAIRNKDNIGWTPSNRPSIDKVQHFEPPNKVQHPNYFHRPISQIVVVVVVAVVALMSDRR